MFYHINGEKRTPAFDLSACTHSAVAQPIPVSKTVHGVPGLPSLCSSGGHAFPQALVRPHCPVELFLIPILSVFIAKLALLFPPSQEQKLPENVLSP